LRRLLAYLSETWSVLNDAPDRIEDTINEFLLHDEKLAYLGKCFVENPRLSRDSKKDISWQDVATWCDEVSKECRLVVVDPLAQIDFPDYQPWKGQSTLIRRFSRTAKVTGSSILLVAHTVKRGGAAAKIPLSAGDVQGAAEIVRLADAALLLNAHDEHSSEVYRQGGNRETVLHNRTLIIEKARHGPGRGARIAFRFDEPRYVELGVIAPRRVKTDSPRHNFEERLPYKDSEDEGEG